MDIKSDFYWGFNKYSDFDNIKKEEKDEII